MAQGEPCMTRIRMIIRKVYHIPSSRCKEQIPAMSRQIMVAFFVGCHQTNKGAQIMHKNTEALLDKLRKVKQTKDGWQACCPAHDDHDPSLGIKEAEDRILLNCLAGCTGDQVMDSLDMPMSSLFFKELDPALRKKMAIDKHKKTNETNLGISRLAANIGATEYKPGTKSTDRANAARLIDQYGNKACYCSQLSPVYQPKNWFIWNGIRWKQDDSDEIYRLGDKVREAVDYLVYLEEDEQQRKALRKVAIDLESSNKVGKMLLTASKFLPIKLDQLDIDPWLLNLTNGTMNLKTGYLSKHQQENYITKVCPVEYDLLATAPTWKAFLDKIFSGNKDLINFMQKVVGYSLTGSTREQVVFFLYGTGKNGKSTFIDTIRHLLGDYAMQTPTSTLMTKRNEGIPNDIARLKGARFVSAVEAEEGKRLSESLIKQLSGGDMITARFMRAEFFEFKPQFKLLFATNHKPIIRGTDNAIWRRIRLIPFSVTITEDERDPELPSKLLEELPGILNWAVEGCLKWQEEGLGLPNEVATATNEYQVESDILAGFIDDLCTVNPLAKTAKSEFYKEYCSWCEETGERALSQRQLGSRMIERGFSETRIGPKGSRYWQGVGLITDTTDTTDVKNTIVSRENKVLRLNVKTTSDTSVVSADKETAVTKDGEIYSEEI